MSALLEHLPPAEFHQRHSSDAVVIDVRTPAEFAAGAVPGAINISLDRLTRERIEQACDGRKAALICRSGNRSEEACRRLAAWGLAAINIHGGLNAWQHAGLPIREGSSNVISLERQVRIAAGSLVVLGSALGLLVSSWFFAVPLFVGAGLVYAGATNSCGMALVLGKMPWNQSGDSTST